MSATGGSRAAALSAAVMVLLTVRFVLPRPFRGVRRLAVEAPAPTAARRSPGPTLVGRLRRPSTVIRRVAVAGLAGVFAVATGSVLGSRTVVSPLAIGAVAAIVWRQLATQGRRRVASARRARVIEACSVLAADLRAGRTPRDALEGAAAVCADLRSAAAAARLGGDVVAALDSAAGTPGAAGLRSLAAAWRVAERSGAAFATIVERLAESLRADEAVQRQVAAGLAGTRSTARLLAGLPLFGTGLGYGVGANPLTFLTATGPGWVCLLGGLALAGLGLEWVERLAAGCERQR